MLFDETSPTLKYFQKPIFGKKTLLKNPDGSRTAASTALTAGLSFMGGLSAFGPEPAKALDNLIQGGPAPKYLSEQQWYQNNVDESNAKANAIGAVTGGIGKAVAGVMTGGASTAILGATESIGKSVTESIGKSIKAEPLKPVGQLSPTDPKVSFNQMLNNGSKQVLTPDQRIQQEQKAKRQMQYLPQYDESDDGSWRFYSDTKPVFGGIPNFLGNYSNKR